MSQPNYRSKDYSDDWDAFERGLKGRTTLDLTYYARNLVTSANRVEGTDDFANALFEKLLRRCKLVNAELKRRGLASAPKSSAEDRKRRVHELLNEYKAATGDGEPTPFSPGARHDDPPIPTRVTPLVSTSLPVSSPESLRTDERLSESEEEEGDAETLHVPKKFRLFQEEDAQQE